MAKVETIKTKVAKNLFWRMLERYAAQIVQFIVTIVLARILMPEVYGQVALITVFIAILNVFIDSGFGNALIQKKDADDLDFSSVFYFNIVVCSVLYVGMFFMAPVIAGFYNYSNLTIVIRVLSLTLIISGLKNVQQAYVSRTLQFKKFFIATIIGTLISAGIGIYLAVSGFGIWALVAQNLSNMFIDTVILWFVVKWKPKLTFSFRRLGSLFKYGWKILVSALLDTGYNKTRQLVIGKMYSSDQLAYYTKGESFPNLIVTNTNSAIDSVLFPVLSKSQEDPQKVKNMTRRAIKTSSYIMAPLMIGLAVVAPSVVKLLLTDKWLPAVPYLQIFCVSYLFYPIHTANLNAMKALGRSDLFLILEVIKKVVGVAILFATLWFGVLAIALGALASTACSVVINSWPNKKLLKYNVFDQLKDIFVNFVPAILMGVIVFGIGYIPINYVVLLFVQVVIGAALYVAFSILLKNDSFYYLYGIINKKKNGKTTGGNSMKKQILVTQSSMPGYCEYIKEIRKLWKTKWLTNNGAIHNKLKSKLKEFLAVPGIELFTNGHLSIELGLQTLDLPKGSEVITTPFTFASTTQAIVRCGLKPVFCDINEDDYTIDAQKLEKLITKNTSAILPVHVYGNVCDVDAIERIAKKHKLKVLYDAAHAFGVKYNGKSIAEYGDISCFSFHATKVFNTVEGGCACYSSEEIGKRLASLKNFGLVGEDAEFVGGNAKMNEFCAAMGICNLKHIQREIGKRKKVVERYLQNLKDIPGIKLNTNKRESVENYAYFPVIINEKEFGATREQILEELKKNNIIARKYFYPATNEFSCYKGMFDLGNTPIASKISKRALTLPLYADLKIKTVDQICNIIKSCKK